MSMLPLSKPFTLADMVGNGRKNREEDVARIRSGLNELNYRTDEDKADEIYTRPLFTAIQMFQKDEGLKQDGWLRPGGPTEERLKKRLEQNIASEGKLGKSILKDKYDSDIGTFIKAWEGDYSKFYLDTKGKPTIGAGFMVPSAEEAKRYPLYKFENNKPTDKATPQEIEKAYATIKGNPFGQSHTAESYQDKTSIGMKQDDIDTRLYQKLRSSVDELNKKFPDFDKVPADVQLGLLDMQYNLGDSKLQRKYTAPVTKEQKGWPKLFDAYAAKDWKTMATESHRKDVQDARNEAVRLKFYHAAQ